MRIIGGNDYYDCGMAYGQDTDVVFVRKTQTFPVKNCPLNQYDSYFYFKGDNKDKFARKNRNRGVYSNEIITHKNDILSAKLVNVYVAAKHYGGIEVFSGGYKALTFWNFEDFDRWLEGHDHEISYVWRNDSEPLEALFEVREATKAQMAWFIDNRVAIAVCYRQFRDKNEKLEWICNNATPLRDGGVALANFNFSSMLDPITCYQEIAMFVGGVLPRNPNPMCEITDQKVIAHKHGFNSWSFRRHKDDPK